MRNFHNTRRAAAGSQYALILGLIGVVALLAITAVGRNLNLELTRVANALGNSSPVTGGSGGGGGGGPVVAADAFSWGSNANGRLGDGTVTNRNAPVKILGPGGTGFLTGITQLKGGEVHGCALASAGTVWCWGYNGNGPLGNGTNTDSYFPVPVTGLSGVSDLGVGGTHNCALTGSTVKCWGYNSGGSVGDGTTQDRNTPQTVIGLGAASSVEAGGYHSCAIVSGGVWCWGYNIFGALGINSFDSNPHTSPVQTVGVGGSGTLSGITSLGLGLYGSCALGAGGQVYCWGWNAYGQIGKNSSGVDQASPFAMLGVGGVGNLTGMAEVSGGTHLNCARSSGGNVYCVGIGDYGSMGDGGNTTRTTPVQVHGPGNVGVLSGISQIATGGLSVCALAGGGQVYCWGYNNTGQLGTGDNTDSNVPVLVKDVGGSGTLSGITYIGSGQIHVHAMR